MDIEALVLGDLLRVTTPLMWRMNNLAGRDVFEALSIPARLRAIAAGLVADPPSPAAARTVMAAVYPTEDPPPGWWKTAAGIQVAAAIGYHRSRCPVIQAAAILNVTRQRVALLVEEGRLNYVDGPRISVSTDSLRGELALYGRRSPQAATGTPRPARAR